MVKNTAKVYMCTGVEVGPEKEYWVTGFSPSMVGVSAIIYVQNKLTEKDKFGQKAIRRP